MSNDIGVDHHAEVVASQSDDRDPKRSESPLFHGPQPSGPRTGGQVEASAYTDVEMKSRGRVTATTTSLVPPFTTSSGDDENWKK